MTDVTNATSTPTTPPPNAAMFDTGSEAGLQGQMPVAAKFTVDEQKHAMNPLQYVPVVGMIYRAVTGESLPPPLSIAGSVVSGAAFGGPLGILGSVALNVIEELIRIGPDTSRPPVPYGMVTGGSEFGVQVPFPGSVAPADSYTTLATTLPDFLGGGSNRAFAGGDQPSGQVRQALAAYDQVFTSTGTG